MERHLAALLPQRVLRDKGAPNIGHSDTDKTREIQERECRLEENRVLRIEGTPRSRIEDHRLPLCEPSGALIEEAVNSIDVWIIVCQVRLNWTLSRLGSAQRRDGFNFGQWQPPRPDQRICEVFVNVDPTLVRQSLALHDQRQRGPKIGTRYVVVVGFKNELGANCR